MSGWLILGAAATGAAYGVAKAISKKRRKIDARVEYSKQERGRVARQEEHSREFHRKREEKERQEKIRRDERHTQLEEFQESGVDVCFRCQISEPERCEADHCICCYDRCHQCGKCLGCEGFSPNSGPYCILHS